MDLCWRFAGWVVARRAGPGVAKAVKVGDSMLRAGRADELGRASVRGLRSLRETCVKLAITAGVPVELAQEVTGYKTTDIVLKRYLQPGREDFRQTLQSAMPKLVTNGHRTPKEEMREVLETVKPKALRERLLKVWTKR